jgi:GT2 family glycosyltransferase
MNFSTCPSSPKSTINASFEWSLIVAVNHEEILRGTLLKSPEIDDRCQVLLKRGYSTAGKAYNAGIAEAKNEILVFAHQDVYLPQGWLNRLRRSVAQLDDRDPNWGVLGAWGVAKSSEFAGHVYSTGLRRTLGAPFDQPIECFTLDEMILIMRRSSGLMFDEQLPAFHLYGTDICLEARGRSLKSYLISAFCIHNSNGLVSLPKAFWKAYLYLRRKWWKQLPIATPCTTITRWCGPMGWSVMRGTINALFSSNAVGTRTADPERLCRDVLNSTGP